MVWASTLLVRIALNLKRVQEDIMYVYGIHTENYKEAILLLLAFSLSVSVSCCSKLYSRLSPVANSTILTSTQGSYKYSNDRHK